MRRHSRVRTCGCSDCDTRPSSAYVHTNTGDIRTGFNGKGVLEIYTFENCPVHLLKIRLAREEAVFPHTALCTFSPTSTFGYNLLYMLYRRISPVEIVNGYFV